MVSAVRGATFVENNTKESIEEATIDLMTKILEANSLKERNIISVVFSLTEDLTAANPASSLRSVGFHDVPLFCVQEPKYQTSRGKTLRSLVTFKKFFNFGKPKPVYTGGAQVLRPDLFS